METNDRAEITASGHESVSCTEAVDAVMNDTLVCPAAIVVLTFSTQKASDGDADSLGQGSADQRQSKQCLTSRRKAAGFDFLFPPSNHKLLLVGLDNIAVVKVLVFVIRENDTISTRRPSPPSPRGTCQF